MDILPKFNLKDLHIMVNCLPENGSPFMSGFLQTVQFSQDKNYCQCQNALTSMICLHQGFGMAMSHWPLLDRLILQGIINTFQLISNQRLMIYIIMLLMFTLNLEAQRIQHVPV